MTLCYLIRTNTLDADERFAKTYQFLQDVGENVQVYGVVKRQADVDSDFIQQQLHLRSVFGSGRLVVAKYAELLLYTAMFLLRHRGRRWFANFDFLPLQLLSTFLSPRHSRPIWDMHEMPPNVAMRNPVIRRIFVYLLRKNHIIVCNQARLDALEEVFGVDLHDALILRNTPGRQAFDQLMAFRQSYLADVTPEDDLRTIIITGGNTPGRMVQESVEVVKVLRDETGIDLRVTLVGGAPLEETYDFVTSTGFIPFDELVHRCVQGGISLCFYRMDSLNNKLCEPNRFYQAVVAGQHVISFNHSSLRDVPHPWHYVVEEEDFGSSLKNILRYILTTPTDPKKRLYALKIDDTSTLVFESQFPLFDSWFESLKHPHQPTRRPKLDKSR